MSTVATSLRPQVHRIPAWSSRDTIIAVGLVIFSILYLWPFRAAFGTPNPDEGIVLQGAIRVLQGQVPYRDFFSFYTPGSFYWNALLMKLFGDSALVPRTALIGYGVLLSLITFVLARRMASPGPSLLATLFLSLCGLPLAFIVIHNWDSTIAALLALFCTELLVDKPRSWLAGLAGLFAGISILFNQARGAGLLMGLVLGLLLLRWRMQRRDLLPRYFVWLGIGALIPLFTTMVLLVRSGAVHSFIACMLWPFQHYSPVNHLPYGFMTLQPQDWEHVLASPGPERTIYFLVFSLIWVICALPVLTILLAGWTLLKQRPDLAPEHVSILVLSGAVTLGSVLSVQATRPDFYHITFISPLFFFVLPWVFQSWFLPFRSLRNLGTLVIVYVLLGSAAYSMTLLWIAKDSRIHLQTRRGVIRVLRPNQTLPFIEANFPPGSKLLVHPYLPVYSFLTRTMTPLPYDFFQPGMHSQQQFQQAVAMLADLKPPAVLFQPEFTLIISGAWPRTPSSALRDPVADYIVHNYKACRRLDASDPNSFLLMVRKDLDCGTYKMP